MAAAEEPKALISAFDSPTFGQDGSFRLDKPVGSASISPCGRDVVLASRQGLHIIDLDSPYSPPRHLPHHTPWEVADVQWSPFAARDYWVVSTSNQKALVWNLSMVSSKSSVEHVLHAHSRAITDINFSAHNPDILSTCAVDSFVHCWDLRHPSRPAMTFCDWFAGATQVKWNRQDSHILASSHDKFLRIWDDRKGAYPLRSIEAHATKIYGVDWSRTETTNLVTCSLDRTIKFWNYTTETNEPDRILHTPFPVWRARHTPFGFGLLAMPQRGDHDLHLYNRRTDPTEDQEQIASTTHKFDGHDDQVKEFLWRPRGNITESNDDRDFQLVSWGTDRVLRLHHVGGDVLASVGHEKGMAIKRRMNFTRRNALYKTFREDPAKIGDDESVAVLGETSDQGEDSSTGIRSALTVGMSRAPVPFIGGYGNGGFMSPVLGRKSATSNEMDPISWMRGVKIGKREVSPSSLHQSMSSILTPSLKADPTWDVFDSLGEEITHVGDKFAKVSFDEVEMQRRKIVVSLSGPWGTSKSSTYVKCRIEFPSTYPELTQPAVSLEKTASISDDTVDKIGSEISLITSSFLSRQRSSLEAILRYILGEQSLEESLLWLKKRRESVDLDSTIDLDLSSSDEDDEALGKYTGPQAANMESSDPMIAESRAQNSPPLPKACGAMWADNGCLVCFFPQKQEKEPSFLDLSLKASDRSSKSRKSIFEGFGRFHNASRRKKQAASTLETIESGDSDSVQLSSSSSGSSSASDDIDLPRHHFMPSMAWRGDASEALPGVSLDESQRSSGHTGRAKVMASKGHNFVSIHDLSKLLPAKALFAREYIIGIELSDYAHNARIARDCGNHDLADVWLFVDLIMQDKVPLEVMNDALESERARDVDAVEIEPILIIARRAVSKVRSKDSAIDLSFDEGEGDLPVAARASVKWGHHPFGRRRFVEKLFCHYEQTADVQMLAMLSCAFSEHPNSPTVLGNIVSRCSPSVSLGSDPAFFLHYNGKYNYYPSEETAKARLYTAPPNLSLQVNYQNIRSGPHSASSSVGAPSSDLSAGGMPPSIFRPLRTNFERRESQATSLSTSLEQVRHTHRSNSNLSTFGGSSSHPFPLNQSAASSPPNAFPKKRLSPAGSYLGTPNSTNTWSPSQFFSRSSTITEDPRSSFTLSMSDTEEDVAPAPKKPTFTTKLKNQDRFQNDSYANVTLLDSGKRERYCAYRESYAHLLHIWGLSIARAEVLQYNRDYRSDPSFAAVKPESLLSIGKSSLAKDELHTEDQHIGFKDRCRSCNTVSLYQSTTRRCQNCSTTERSPICLLCNTCISGLSSPCLNCGHVLHAFCRELLLSQPSEEIASACVSGCNCICADYATVEIEAPVQPTKFTEEVVSPAVTIIGDAPADEQEQLGWYDNSEWEDMAYESLVRNLRPRNEIKPKSSQVWRGRKGSAAG